jgi:predicted MFS family arabinose efflux permease
MGPLILPAALFALTTIAAGAVVTYLPLALPRAGNLVPVALFVQAGAATAARWLAGRHADRHGPSSQLVPAVMIAALGIAVVAWTPSAAINLGGMVAFGIGFGVAQNASFTLMLSRVSPAGYDAVSALWNLAYDAGLGVGGLTLGGLAARTGYAAAFLLLALAMVLAASALSRIRAPVSLGPAAARPQAGRQRVAVVAGAPDLYTEQGSAWIRPVTFTSWNS